MLHGRDLIETLLRRQQVLADFGDFALQSEDPDEVLTEACRQMAKALGVSRASVLELRDDGRSLFLRAGVGWGLDVVGQVCLPMTENSLETRSFETKEPVVIPDMRTDTRFEPSDVLRRQGVVAQAIVPIFLPEQKAYGLLQVADTMPRDFAPEDTAFLRTYARILGPVIDRLFKLSALRASEERFRLIVEATTDYAIFVTDVEDRITSWLPGAAAVFGWSPKEAVGQSSAIIFTPEDRAVGQPEWEVETARREGSAPNVREHLRKDGSRVFIEGTVRALTGTDGQPIGFLKIGQDVTEQRAASERLRTLMEGLPQLVWRSFDGGEWSWASPQWLAFTGQSQEQSHGQGWLDAVHPDDRGRAMRAWEAAIGQGLLEVEHRIRRASDDTYLWHHTRSVPARDAGGRITEWLGTSTDVQVLKEMQKRQGVLVAELHHRTRNLMTIILSVMKRTRQDSVDVEQFATDLRRRYEALARVNGLLSQLHEGHRVVFDELLQVELQATGALDAQGWGPQVTLTGPAGIQLRSSTVQTFALAIHELATNAARYGALAQRDGRLAVHWSRVSNGREPRLQVEWIETGVIMSEPAAAPRSPGFGRELLERGLPHQFGAETRYELGTNGVRCTITLPLSSQDGAADG